MRSSTARSTLTFGFILCCVGGGAIAEPTLVVEKIALTGERPPQSPPGAYYTWIETPTINNAGDVAFVCATRTPGRTTSDDLTLVVGSPDALHIAYQDNSPIPSLGPDAAFGNPNYYSGYYLSPAISDDGKVVFAADVVWPSMNFTGSALLLDTGEDIVPLALAGDNVPGAPAATIAAFGPGPFLWPCPTINNAGSVVFHANLAGPQIDESNDSGYFRLASGPIETIIRRQDEIAGLTADSVYFSQTDTLTQNSAGFCVVSIGSANPDPQFGTFGIATGQLTPFARTGDIVPAATPTTLVDKLYAVSINTSNHVAFLAQLSVPEVGSYYPWGVCTASANGITKVVVTGDSFDGARPGEVFQSLVSVSNSAPAINDNDHVAFFAQTVGGDLGLPPTVLLTNAYGPLAVVARNGGPAPGFPNAVFTSIANDASHPSETGLRATVCMNAADQIAFQGYVNPRDGTPSRHGIWLTRPDGVLQCVITSGMQIDVDNDPNVEDLRTVGLVNLIHGSGGGDGRRRGLNDNGQIACLIVFTDNSRGVFRLALSESTDCVCPGDVSSDGVLDGRDVQAFMNCLLGDAGPGCECADANGDDLTNLADIAGFAQQLIDGFTCQ
ncbi:MAG TPA: hypothetical protein P5081_15285 [Phycisphaerae bacterium]|nr:hypothetical protein [Phycisphaerae bacterium]HRW54234.1 hypothetical protein [Phycisphaerae bacterium]